MPETTWTQKLNCSLPATRKHNVLLGQRCDNLAKQTIDTQDRLPALSNIMLSFTLPGEPNFLLSLASQRLSLEPNHQYTVN